MIEHSLVVFKSKSIRRTLHNNEWWFAINDIVEALTDSPNVSDYIKKMRNRDDTLSEGWGQIVTPLAIETAGGAQKLNCANAEGIFRIIQSIPSPKAEPFKRWLAKVGYERVRKIEDQSNKFFVIPAKAGIHTIGIRNIFWIPAFAGMTDTYGVAA